MSEPFVGQITMISFNWAPKNYAQCNGQLMTVQQNQALYALLGNQFGGTPGTNFNLPDLRSRSPVGAFPSSDIKWQPTAYPMGQQNGVEEVTLTTNQIPAHSHGFGVSLQTATDSLATTGYNLGTTTNPTYTSQLSDPPVPLGGAPLGGMGNGPHANMQAFLTVNMCIALAGIWPPRQ